MTVRVVLTGGTGFIGSAVLGRLTGRDASVRAVTRREVPLPPQVEQVRADLTRPASLSGVCSGADVLVHAASHVGSGEQLCTQVNELGTAALMEEA
ncbi:MAG TPA: NAD(P)-dependent oxidoreductase, partial [Streptomyces sp.]|nr:NAD(P)-dependent oxidoreductase [Streptomyces sp.]